MNENQENNIEQEIIVEEYMLGKDYYNKILDKAKEEIKKYE